MRGGGVGVHAKRGASLTLKDVAVRDNAGTGLLVEAKSSAEPVDIVADRSGGSAYNHRRGIQLSVPWWHLALAGA